MISCGFPQNVLSELLYRFDEGRIDKQEKAIVVSGFLKIKSLAFTDWKNSTAFKVKIMPGSPNDKKQTSSMEKEIIEKLRGFHLANKTPIECQQFIHTLQAQLNGTI